jgi:excisionase family DNA binding protein
MPTGNQRKDPGLDDLITLNQAAKLSGFSTRHLRHLASTGEIWAKKLGRNWVTTKQAIQEYLAQDRKPGPKSN